MTKPIKTTILPIGAITIAAGIFSFVKGDQEAMTYIALFTGLALIGTAIFNKNSTDPKL